MSSPDLRARLDQVLALARERTWLVLAIYLTPDDLDELEDVLEPPDARSEGSVARHRGYHIFHDTDFTRYDIPWAHSASSEPFTNFSRETVLGIKVHYIQCDHLEGEV